MKNTCLVLSGLENLCDSDTYGSYMLLGKWMSLVPENIIKNKIIYYKPDEEKPFDIIDQHKYISGIYKSFLIELTNILNEYHGEDMSVRQWEIIIGPWLKLYSDSLFVRWKLLSSALTQMPETVCILDTKRKNTIPVPVSRDDFSKLLNDNMHWNQVILAEAFMGLSKNANFNVVTASLKQDTRAIKNTDKALIKIKSFRGLIKKFARNRLKLFLECISNFLSNNNSIVISTPYISIKNQLKICLELRSMPVFYFNKKYNCNVVSTDLSKREVLKSIRFCCSDDFSEFAGRMIHSQLPTCYFEDWEFLKAHTQNLKLPKKIKFIYAGSSSASDECFRLYIAKQVAIGAKYVISQHGGVYGVSLIPPKAEFFEHRVVDKWISWGWSSSDNKVLAGPNTKMLSYAHAYDGYGEKLLLALPNMENAPSRIVYSDPESLIDIHLSVLNGLDDVVKSKTIIRPIPLQRGRAYLKVFSKGFDFSNSKSFWGDINRSKLFLCTSNSTTLLEALAANFPTIILLGHTERFIRPEAQEYYNELERVGILFNDPVLAATQINKIWLSVDTWWQNSDLQSVRNRFCKQYSSLMSNDIERLAACINA